MADSYYLVNLVDNDYPKESCLWSLLEAMFNHRQEQLDDVVEEEEPHEVEAQNYSRYTMQELVEAAQRPAQEHQDDIPSSW